MNIKCNAIVDAWLGQILVKGCEVGILLFTQTMPAIKLYPVQVFVSNKISTRGDEGGVINEDIVVFHELSLDQILLKTCHEILVLEVIGDSCSRQRVGSVQQRVSSVHYQFKLLLEIFIWEGIRRI